MYQAYFVDNINIGSIDILARIADELDLDSADLRVALDQGRYKGRVLTQYEEAHAVGVTGVPTFVAADKYALVGAHPLENFRKLMEAVGASPRGTGEPALDR